MDSHYKKENIVLRGSRPSAWGAHIRLYWVCRHTSYNKVMFGGLWGPSKPKPTAKELVKEQKKAVRKSQREIDREMRNLEKGEKKLMADIKKAAQKGDNGAYCGESPADVNPAVNSCHHPRNALLESLPY